MTPDRVLGDEELHRLVRGFLDHARACELVMDDEVTVEYLVGLVRLYKGSSIPFRGVRGRPSWLTSVTLAAWHAWWAAWMVAAPVPAPPAFDMMAHVRSVSCGDCGAVIGAPCSGVVPIGWHSSRRRKADRSGG